MYHVSVQPYVPRVARRVEEDAGVHRNDQKVRPPCCLEALAHELRRDLRVLYAQLSHGLQTVGLPASHATPEEPLAGESQPERDHVHNHLTKHNMVLARMST
jgi:hypothetical protein